MQRKINTIIIITSLVSLSCGNSGTNIDRNSTSVNMETEREQSKAIQEHTSKQENQSGDIINTSNVLVAIEDLTEIRKALGLFKLKNHRYPDSLSDLVSSGTLSEPLPPDPWGNEYQYSRNKENDTFLLISLGSDGKPGGNHSGDLVMSNKHD